MNKILISMRWPVGGIRTYMSYIYRFPALKPYQYSVVSPKMELRDYFDDIFPEGYQYIESEEANSSFFKTLLKSVKSMKPDLIHSHGMTAGLLSSVLAKAFGIKHILTTHDVFLPGQFDGFSGAIKKKIISMLLKMPDVINPCGFDASENIKEFHPGIPEEKIKPIRNGIDVSKFSNEEVRDLRSELNQDSDTVLLGFFGRFMKQKGFDLLVKAIESHHQKAANNLKLHVVCFGWGAFIREEQANIKKLGLDQYFSFMPQTDNMPAALRGVDIAVMPSRWEACPLLPMEASVSGTVVLASDCIGMKEVCSLTTATMFSQENVGELKDKIYSLSGSLSDHKAKAQAFKDQAKELFDSRNTAQSLSDLYIQTLEANK